jgi:SSS family solute:Na+ symporter
VAGVIMAALIGAAMCALASDLNSLSSVGVADIYRMIRPGATDRERLRMGKYIVAGCGIACILTALVLGQMKGSALSMWFTVSAVAIGGLAGLWALAFLTSRASRRGVYVGIVLMLLFTAWSSMTLSDKRLIDLGVWNFRWHDYMIGAIGHVILFVFGYAASLLLPDRETAEHLRGTTIWNWLRSRREHLLESAASTPVV